MKGIIEKVPIPLSGVMLGSAACGNLLQSYSEALRWGFGLLATALLALLLLKLLMFFSAVKEELKNPIIASVACTFPMGVMLLSVYYKPFIGAVSQVIWFVGIALHVALMLNFTAKFMVPPEVPKVFASYFIVYVGIAVTGITAPAYSMTGLGMIAFWFGLVCLFPLLLLVCYRHIKFPAVPEPAQPLFCIIGAPASLCLAAYIQSADTKSITLVKLLAVLSTVLYLVALTKLILLLKSPFYPSHAAFTFPFVISAIAIKQTTAFLGANGYVYAFLPWLVIIETVIAALLVCFTVLRFATFLLQKPKVTI